MKKWPEDKIEYLVNNYEIKTNKEICKYLNKSSAAVRNMAFQMGLTKNRETYCKAHRHKSIEITKEILKEKYIKEGKSIRKIAVELGLGKNTISHYLNKFKISARTISEANKNFYSRGGKIWKTGLSKETDRRIASMSIKLKKSWAKRRAKKFLNIELEFGASIRELIKDMYWNKNFNQESIARKIGLSRELVIRLMERFRIKKRPNYEYISSLKGISHPQFGKKWEDIYGVEKAKKLRAERSDLSRKNIIKRLKNREMPFKDTEIEKAIAKELSKRNIDFISQYPVDEKFVCDFALPKYKIIIECDGDYWHANPKLYSKLNKIQERKIRTDKFKDKYLSNKGWIVIRFFESDIKESSAKCIDLVKEKVKKVQNPLDNLK